MKRTHFGQASHTFRNSRPAIGWRFCAAGWRRYLTIYAATSAQLTVNVASEERKPEQKSDGSVEWDLPSNQIESGSAMMEVSTREILNDYFSGAQRSCLWNRSGSLQSIAPVEHMSHSRIPGTLPAVRIAINTNRFHFGR
jgi:hypothetical protein